MIRHHQLAANKRRHTVPIPEVQILGSLIGTGLSDTGTADVTNLLVSTQQAFSGLDWVATNMTVADSVATDLNGATTASTLTETTANSHHLIAQGFYTAASAAQYSHAFYIAQGLRTRAALVIRDSNQGNYTSANFAFVTFDLAGDQIGVAAAVGGTFTSPSATIVSKAHGLFLCTLTATTGGSGKYDVELYADNGSGTGASSTSYTGNSSAPALTIWGAGVWAGAAGTYVPLNANAGAAASTVQQAFSPNGTTTAYWGTQTNNAWVGFDATIPVTFTRHRFAPRPSAASQIGQWPLAPDYALSIAGAQVQTDVADSTFASPTTVDTLPAANVLPYYPRYWLSERTVTAASAARYARFLPVASSFGGLSEWQVFAKASPLAPACPAQPTISPNGGRFPGLAAVVTITSLTAGASIYYTTDGTTPTTASRKYTGPIILSIGSGATVTVKAVAHLNTLSTPLSLVTTSGPFYGYGYKPNDNWYDTVGNLTEAHAGSVMWDPNTSAYYWVGQFQNINTVLHFSTTPEPNYAPAVFLYKSTDLMNVTNLGPILNDPFPNQPIAGNYNIMYNALNNNYVIWTSVINSSNQANLYYASTSGSNIKSGWSWNLTPIVSNTFFNFSIMIDSDGATAYVVWRPTILGTSIQQLNSSYTGLTGSPLILTNAALREGFALFKWPNVTGGTYFLVSGAANPYDSSQNINVLYTYNQGSSPLANSWNAVPSSGADAWNGFGATGTQYNGQPFFAFQPQGTVQPFLGMDFWVRPLYGSRQVWMPMVMGPKSLAIQHPVSWDPSQLATTYTLSNLTLSGSTFVTGATQGTVIGTASNYLVQSWVTLTDSHSGAVQFVGGVLQVGATPPGSSGSFNISLTETPTVGAPHVTTLSITETATGGSLSGSVVQSTTQQSLNLTSLGATDWIAYGYNVNAASFDRKSTGGSKISTITQVGSATLTNFNYTGVTPNWISSWTDGTTTGTVSNESYMVYAPDTTGLGPGHGESFTVLADTTTRTLKVYVGLSSGLNSSNCTLTATLSDGSASPYVDSSVQENSVSTNLMAVYTIVYAAASSAQTLTVTWLKNDSHTGNVIIHAAALS